MRTMTAAKVSRGSSKALDTVEHGDTVIITRAGVPVAELRPITATTGRALAAALDRVDATLDDAFEAGITAATSRSAADESDAWSGA